MRLVELECPKCGARLSKVNGTDLQCKYCGAVYLESDLEVGVKSEKQQNLKQKDSDSSRNKAVTSGLWIGVAIATASCMIGIGLTTMAVNFGNSSEPPQVVVQEEQDDVVGVIPMSGVPQAGEGFRVFAEKIFDKGYAALTEEDFAKVTELYISGVYEDHDVVCVVDGEIKEFYYWGTTGSFLEDFGLFANLEVLELDGVLYDTYAENMPSLKHLKCSSDMEDLVVSLPHPEQLTYLAGVSIYDTTEGLEAFSNLQVLEIEACDEDIVNLSVLGSYEHLEELTLTCSSEVKNFNFLSELKNLRKLSIDAPGLFSIEFARNLSKLEVLDISKSSVESLAPLEGNSLINELRIVDCEQLKDYSVVGSLTGLNHLSLTGDEREEAIEWANLTNLKSLYIEFCYSCDFANEVPDLEKLSIKYDRCDFDELSALSNLKELELSNTNDFMYFMKDLQNLEVLKVHGNNAIIFDSENIFNLPKLREINLDDVTMAIDFDKLQENSVLEKFFIYDTSFCKPDLEDIEINDAILEFAQFHGITELAVCHVWLESAEFALEFQGLKRLDITDSYINDVSILSECQALEWLRCDESLKDSVAGLDIEVEFE